MADFLQGDINKARAEKERIQKDFYDSREELLQKEFQLKEERESNQQMLEQINQHNKEELRKLQDIIDEQTELIRSYERYY